VAERFTPDGYKLLLHLIRAEIPEPELYVFTRQNDPITKFLPKLVIRRTGGAVIHPAYSARWLCSFQLWMEPPADGSTTTAVLDLGNRISQLLWQAWKDQVTTPHGHIASWREAVGWQDETENALPLYGHAIASYEFLLRAPRS
jgi:hypothetical protein